MPRGYVQDLRLFGRDTWSFIAVCGLHAFAFMGVYGLLLNLYLLRLGYGPEFIGLFNGAGDLAAAGIAIPAGAAGRLWGIRPVMVVGLALAAIAAAVLPAGEFLQAGQQEVWLIASNVCLLTATTLFFANGNPFMMSITRGPGRNQAFSVRWATLAVASFGGSVVGGFLPGVHSALLGSTLADPAPYRAALWTATVLVAIAAWALFRSRDPEPEERSESEGRGGTSAIKMVALVALVMLFLNSASAALSRFFNVYMDLSLNVSTAQIGVLVGIGGLGAVPAALLMPAVARRLGNGGTAVFAALGGALCLLPLALIPNVASAGLGFVGASALTGTFWPAFSIFTMGLVPSAWRPVMYGSVLTASGLCAAALGLGGGIYIGRFGFSAYFLMAMAATLIGVALFGVGLLTKLRSTGERMVSAADSGSDMQRGRAS